MLSVVNCSWTRSQFFSAKYQIQVIFPWAFQAKMLVSQHTTSVECLKHLECFDGIADLGGNKDRNIDAVPLNMPVRGFSPCGDVAVSTETYSLNFGLTFLKHQTCFSQNTFDDTEQIIPPSPCSLLQLKSNTSESQGFTVTMQTRASF